MASSEPPRDAADEKLRAEALRVYRRYAIEVVEAMEFCPWAAKARREGVVREHVILARGEPLAAALTAALTAIDEVARATAIEIGLLIFPRVRLDRRAFERFVARVREADATRCAPRPIPLAMAAFHPDATADLGAPSRLTPFLRRTPDPTIQLVRQSTLDSVRKNEQIGTAFFDPTNLANMSIEELVQPPAAVAVPMHERVAKANLETVRRRGVAEIEAILADIAADRDRAYAALGEIGG
jgi:hypothetical protein